MNTFSIHITGDQAIKLLRAVRIGGIVEAIPAEAGVAYQKPYSLAELRSRGMGELLDWLHTSQADPLKVLVNDPSKRLWSNGIRCFVRSGETPADGALLLQKASGPNALDLPKDIDVYIDSPAYAFVHTAHELESQLAQTDNVGLRIRLRVIEFACECCGAYVRDPLHPRTTIAHYDKPGEDSRLCTLNDIRSFAEEAVNVPGRRRAIQLLRHAIDGSGSGMETYLNLAFAGTQKLGGLSMSAPLVNHELVVNEEIKALLKHRSIRPDMQWPDYRTLIEFLGEEAHSDKRARVEDKNRLHDYAVAGYIAFTLMSDDVRSTSALNKTAQMIGRTLMQRGKRNELYRIQSLLKDEEFLSRQSVLVSTLLPPVTRYDT